jgi:hypothetical protein
MGTFLKGGIVRDVTFEYACNKNLHLLLLMGECGLFFKGIIYAEYKIRISMKTALHG